MQVDLPRLRASRSTGSALVLLAAVLLLSQAACVVHHHGRDGRGVVVHRDDTSAHAPALPPWAPAHGHRHKHREGIELRYDAGLGVYLVVGHPGHYFRGELFFQQVRGTWTASTGIEGPWWTVAVEDVPLGLRRTEAKRKRRHPKHRGPLPARHD
jgi:hypothetical protein